MSAALPWFRLYHEIKDDPKMGALTDGEFRVFIESLCWACAAGKSGSTGLTLDNCNWAFRRNVTDAVTRLLQVGVLCLDESNEIAVPKWDERQKRSDSSRERVRKYREKQDVTLHETLQKRYSNGVEESRVDKSSTVTQSPAPIRASFNKPTIDEVKLNAAKIGLPEHEAEKFFNYYESNGWRVGRNPMKSWTSAMINWRGNWQKGSYGTSQTYQQRNDRNSNNTNAGRSSQYRGVGKVG